MHSTVEHHNKFRGQVTPFVNFSWRRLWLENALLVMAVVAKSADKQLEAMEELAHAMIAVLFGCELNVNSISLRHGTLISFSWTTFFCCLRGPYRPPMWPCSADYSWHLSLLLLPSTISSVSAPAASLKLPLVALLCLVGIDHTAPPTRSSHSMYVHVRALNAGSRGSANWLKLSAVDVPFARQQSPPFDHFNS